MADTSSTRVLITKNSNGSNNVQVAKYYIVLSSLDMYCHTELIDMGDEEEELVDLNETLLTLFSTSVKFVEVITHPQLISCPRGPNHELTEEEVGIEKRKKVSAALRLLEMRHANKNSSSN